MRGLVAKDTNPGLVLVLVVILPAGGGGVLDQVGPGGDLLGPDGAPVLGVPLLDAVVETVHNTDILRRVPVAFYMDKGPLCAENLFFF